MGEQRLAVPRHARRSPRSHRSGIPPGVLDPVPGRLAVSDLPLQDRAQVFLMGPVAVADGVGEVLLDPADRGRFSTRVR
jgi:hypothetical protein